MPKEGKMTNVTAAKAAMRDLGVKAKEVVESSRTAAEKKDALDKIEVDLKAFSDEIAVHEKAQKLIAGADAPEEHQAKAAEGRKSFIDEVTGHKDFADIQRKAAAHSKFDMSMEFDNHLSVKAAAATITEGTAASGYGLNGTVGVGVTPTFLPGIVDLRFQKLTIADLFASGSTESPLVSYVVETGWNDNAAPVAEGGLKPQSDGSFARVAEQVGKIANTLKMSDEMVQDASQFRSFLQNRLVFSIQRQEEVELLNGSGYPSVKGLLGRSGLAAPITTASVATAGATAIMEGVFQQITALRTVSFVEPDAFVMNPADWETIRLAKDKNGQYYAGGPFQYGSYGAGTPSNEVSLWGLRGVLTTAVAQGTVIVGGWQENGQIFRKQGITVEMTNSNVDDFVHNLITVRAEERCALAVYRPNGFGLVTITA